MPVPDIQERFYDFVYCETCGKDCPDNQFRHVVVQEGKSIKPGLARVFGICEDCYKKCQTDEAYDKYVTDFVLSRKLGRLINIKGKK